MRKTLTFALTVAVALVSAISVSAQEPTRPVSDVRIPVRKSGDKVAIKESAGEVELAAERAAINALEARVEVLQQRIDAMEADATTMRNRSLEAERTIAQLREELRVANTELTSLRSALAAEVARNAELAQGVDRLDRRVRSLRYGSMFGQSGFYLGLGTGVNVPTGTLNRIGYGEGLNLVMPIGWSKPGNLLGVRAELGVQTFEGRIATAFANPDPRLYTANVMMTLNFPLNNAKTHTFYLMGGGGAFMFQRVGGNSALRDRFEKSSTVTKFGLSTGAGAEFHILGATSLFVQTQLTNVFANGSSTIASDDGRSLRWVPVVAGITLR